MDYDALPRFDSTWQQACYNFCRQLEGPRNLWSKGPGRRPIRSIEE